MKLVVGCDEAAFQLKEQLKSKLQSLGHDVTDVGVFNEDPSLYPDTAKATCEKITDGSCERGFLLCGTGIGMCITANKVPGIRAAVGHDMFSVERSAKSNNCQVLCMGARVVAPQYALMLAEHWLGCSFEGGGSAEKVDRIMQIESDYRK